MLTALVVFILTGLFFFVFGEKEDRGYYITMLSVPAAFWLLVWIFTN